VLDAWEVGRPQRIGDVEVTVGADHVATMEVRRPPNNFFDVDLIRTLADVAETLAADGRSRVVVLAAEGKHFCAGANFTGGGADGVLTAEQGPMALYEQGLRLFAAPLPIVAAVQGAAIGGGLGLACAADFRVASAASRFAANFARLGFHQGFGLSVSLPAIVGQQAALDLLYTGRRIDGAAAHRIGLVDRLVDDADIRGAAHALALDIAASAPLAVASIRATMRADLVERVREVLRREATEQVRLRATADFAEGVRASSERREPDFAGR
jgi:enoyl-CoA hydratase/carnithine racemase